MSGLAAGAVGLVLGGAGAVRLEVRPQRLDRALVAAAAQAQVSIGGDFASCGAEVRGVSGVTTVEAAFDRLTRRSGCHVVRLDASTYLVRRRAAPASPPRPAPRPPPQPTADAGEVVITADRTPQLRERTAATVAVLAGGRLDLPLRPDVRALMGDVASLESTNLGPGRDKLFLRGLSDGAYTGATASTVALYLDDLPITYNAPDPDLRLADLDRVEVVEGPQGALYGAGAMGGVVRLVTRAPDLGRAGGSLAAGVSAAAEGGVGDNLELTLNAPLVRERVGVRLVAYRERTPGYIDDLGLHASDVNRARRDGGRASLLWRVSDRWSATASATYQVLDTSGAQYAVRGLPDLTRATAVAEPHDNDFSALSAAAHGRVGGGMLDLSVAFVRHASATTYDATDGAALFAPLASGSTAYSETHRRGLVFSEALFTSGPVGRATWRAGAFAAYGVDDARNLLAGVADLAATPLLREDRRDRLTEAALFGEYAYRFTGRLTLRAGVRVFRSELDVRSLVRQPPAGPGAVAPFAGSAVTVDAAPKVVLEYTANRRLFGYLSFASGYRPAGFNTLAPAVTAFDAPGEPPRRVKADTARTVEAGVKFAVGGAWLNAALFYTDWLNLQSDQFTAFHLPVSVNVGDAVIPGLELGGRLPLAGGLALTGSLLLDDPQLTSDRNLAFQSRGDAGLPGVSSTSAALGLQVARDGPFGVRLQGDMRMRYVGPSRLSFDAAPAGREGDYLSVDAQLTASHGRWAVELAATNLGDSHANTFAFGNPFSAGSASQITPLRPRTLSLEVRRTF